MMLMLHTATRITTSARISSTTRIRMNNVLINIPGVRPDSSVTRRFLRPRPQATAARPGVDGTAPASQHGGPW